MRNSMGMIIYGSPWLSMGWGSFPMYQESYDTLGLVEGVSLHCLILEEIEQQECCRSKIVFVAHWHLCLLRNRSICTNYVYPFVLLLLILFTFGVQYTPVLVPRIMSGTRAVHFHKSTAQMHILAEIVQQATDSCVLILTF